MAEGNSPEVEKRPADLNLNLHGTFDDSDGIEVREGYQGPHDWRKRLRPVQSPIKLENPEGPDCNGHVKDNPEKFKEKGRPLPPWKRDLIEKNKKVARLVRRESSGRSNRNPVVRRESSGRSKRPPGSESPSGIQRKRSFQKGSESAFAQQVLNEGLGKKRVSPANSFKVATGVNVRRTPSDKVLDPNDPQVKKRVERVRRARLYLLQQLGPNSFLIVGDSPEHKFKVIIGPQTCSCGKGIHCVHVLFVMLRVFQVSESDVCLWSKALKNYEVENLFRVYNDKRSLRIKKERVQRSTKHSSLYTSDSPSPETSATPSECDMSSTKEEDDTCPICLLEMLEGESLLKCNGCQNRLHHHCITVWFEECRRQNDPLICPLCRSKWKNANVEVKNDEGHIEPTEAPPNTRAPSPQHDLENMRLPYAEPIPEEYTHFADSWVQVLGTDLVACLFSKNWSIRETGLKHLEKEVSTVCQRGLHEMRNGNSGNSSQQTDMTSMLQCFCNIVSFISADPVYKVFVGGLKVLRSILANNVCTDDQQRTPLKALCVPIVDAIIIKCSDGNRRMSQLSLSTILELAKGQNGELAIGRAAIMSSQPATLGLGGMSFVIHCVTREVETADITWQWLLGRLYVIEKLITDFPSEFLPRQSPDGASSESSLEAVEIDRHGDDEKPQNYDRLIIIAEFAVKAVCNSHTRISRMAKRVFLLAARFSAHVESLIVELDQMLSNIDSTHRKSLRRQFEKILADFQLSERLVHELRVGNDLSPLPTPIETPASTRRCNSPHTSNSTSDNHSETGSSITGKYPLPVPPNTPIRDRRKHLKAEHRNQKSFDYVEEEESSDNENVFHTIQSPLKQARSLDSLDTIDQPKKSKRKLSKSPLVSQNRGKRGSRSRTPQRIGPVLETDIDEAIRQQEKQRSSLSSPPSEPRNLTYGGSSVSDNSMLLTPPCTPEHAVNSQETPPSLPISPPPQLEGTDIETDIDTADTSEVSSFDMHPFENLSVIEERSFEAKGTSQDFQDLSVLHKRHSTPVSSDTDTTPDSAAKSSVIHTQPSQYSGVNKSLSSAFQCVRPSEKVSTTRSLCGDSITRPKSPYHSSSSCYNARSKLSTCANSEPQPCCSNSFTANKSSRLSVSTNQSSQCINDSLELSPVTHNCTNEKPVTFHSEVGGATPKTSPAQTSDQDEEEYFCKEEVEKEEALALARAMEVSAADPPKPVVPGLTPMDVEEVITVQIQPEDCEESEDQNGNAPQLYMENFHWQKGRLLGTGAFSTCYQARDVKTGILMAVKQISFCRNLRSEQEKVIQNITDEIHMMSRLKHPNIVRIMGATKQGCHFNMFIEWMPGGSVASLLGLYGPFVENVITNYALQILRGLAYLHDSKVLHRDLKGANLLLDSTGQRLRIGDFGTAAKLASRQTGAGEFKGELLGTIAFMAPEVLRGENYGRACDVWSVGCALIEMATTKPPWNANDLSNHLALIFRIANSNSTPPIPETQAPPLRDLMLRCLEPVKEQRPTAKDLLIHPLFTQYMRGSK